jgi:hypothetical protein
MTIEFVAIVPSKGNEDIVATYSIFGLFGTSLAQVDNKDEQNKLNLLQQDKKYKITITEIEN